MPFTDEGAEDGMMKRLILLVLFLLPVLAGCGMAADGSAAPTVSSENETAGETTSRFPENPNKDLEFDTENLEEIYLAGGCFWGVEAFMSRVYGVYDVTSGYANGNTENPTYQDVLGGSGHAETVHVRYDPERVSLEKLLSQFFSVIDPTSVNQQGNDRGIQYRTGVYYVNEADLPVIESVIAEEAERYDAPIATEVEPLESYTLAEEYHQDYLEKNPDGYCHIEFDSLEDQKIPAEAQ
ncbi:peptide-methionine (S)-S-oxide reductase MsrA [Indiicoccus explosivorum]|uniref:peptide-methionine (S)-S-oxide reductase MsrA n=1 Tax=Indiicoccus explosivorum TaxID=1917864 RepID=UPI001F4D659C|nr:peptide-methionine (S)-S-oxide reductase MsrA [Indiicoccus explosivorum]